MNGPIDQMNGPIDQMNGAPWHEEVLPGMETFVHATHGWRWTRLDTLIDRFDDRERLAAEVGGFGEHVVAGVVSSHNNTFFSRST